jgi:hypothetical protein
MVKNSRIERMYRTLATVSDAMKYGPPRSTKLREQSTSATHSAEPSTYTRHAGVMFTIFPRRSATVLPQAPTA